MKDTIIDSFLESVTKYPEKEALSYKKGHHFESLSYEDLYKYAEKLAVFMREKGIGEHDNVVLISENRPEWVIADIATLILGAVLVPIHSVLSGTQIQMIVEEVEPKIIFISDKKILTKALEVENLVQDQHILVYFDDDLPKNDPMVQKKRLFSFREEVFDRGYEHQIEPVKHDSDRVITIIYTSGTTGRFKGAMLTNKNIVSNIESVLSIVPVSNTDKFLSILPLSHIFERTVGYSLPFCVGASISYVLDPAKLAEIAAEEKPTIIIGVPRLYEKVYEAVKDKAQKSPIKKIMFNFALKIGKTMPKDTLAYKMADKIVFHKIKAAFGGQIRFFVSGAASLQQEVGEFFDALSIPVLEGFGLTETSPIVSCNTLEKRKYGTIGRAIPGVEVKLNDGELLIKGPNVMKGYYKSPEKTKEAITEDGWFKTGDLAEIDSEGFIKFLGREKEIIVLSTGKNVSPAMVEEKLELCPCVSQAFVFGDGKKHVGALVVPNKEKVGDADPETIKEKIMAEINDMANKHLASFEQIKKFAIIPHQFTVENGMLTPTLKLRRKEIAEKYLEDIREIYQ